MPGYLYPIIFVFTPATIITHRMATDPKWQFYFNAFFTVLWIGVMIYTPTLPAFRGTSNMAALLIMEVSLWANFITHYGALGANLAAIIASGEKI